MDFTSNRSRLAGRVVIGSTSVRRRITSCIRRATETDRPSFVSRRNCHYVGTGTGSLQRAIRLAALTPDVARQIAFEVGPYSGRPFCSRGRPVDDILPGSRSKSVGPGL